MLSGEKHVHQTSSKVPRIGPIHELTQVQWVDALTQSICL